MSVSDEQKKHVRSLLVEGKKIEAIKYLRDNFNLNLKSAKQMAELIDEDIREDEYQYERTIGNRVKPVAGKAGCAIRLVFPLIGLIMLSVAVSIWISNQNFAEDGVLTTGEVISNPSQPTFEYEYEGETYTHYSSASSDPPSFYLGEKVDIFVNPDDPEDVLVNTFMDRWFVITLLGGMGMLFLGAGAIIFFTFKK